MEIQRNHLRGRGLRSSTFASVPRVRTDPTGALALLSRCPAHAPTPLHRVDDLAKLLGVAQLHLKDERARMGLGSFKALGAGHVIAGMAADRLDRSGTGDDALELSRALNGTVFVCASAGNHGLSVAAAATLFGATARITLSTTVPEAFADRLRERGAIVVRDGDDYEASMAAAERDAAAAADEGWILLSDSSWPGYLDVPLGVMEGYLVLADEIIGAIDPAATHVLVQAGVGGLAAALCALVRERWGDAPQVVVIEPARAPALQASIRAERPVHAPGPTSSMGRLDCKEPSLLALAELARSADAFVTLEDEEAAATVELLRDHGIDTTPSGAAGVAALHHAAGQRERLGIDRHSRVVAIITEAPEGGR